MALIPIALAICAVLALRSQRSIGRSVALMQFALTGVYNRSGYDLIQEKIDRINGELRRFAAEDRHRATDENIPPISISAGIAHGSMAEDPAELFRNDDLAMYESKRRGRSRYTFYPFDEEETLTDVR